MKNLDDYSVLTVPGREGAGPDHWLSHWEAAMPAFTRVQQASWVAPVYAEWAAALSARVAEARQPVLLLAHSLGTSLVMRWAFEHPDLARRVAGAFLAAPSDRDAMQGRADVPVQGFGPMLLAPLPFASLVLGSRNDPFVSLARAQQFAAAWGSSFVDAGEHGHLSSAAQLGCWPAGLIALGQFLASLP
jgi:predicted alpha/beta hydrolase family esterase